VPKGGLGGTGRFASLGLRFVFARHIKNSTTQLECAIVKMFAAAWKAARDIRLDTLGYDDIVQLPSESKKEVLI
jgi:hypothetical protein